MKDGKRLFSGDKSLIDAPTTVEVRYNDDHTGSLFVSTEELETAVWARLKLAIRSKALDYRITGGEISLSWPDVLGVVRELGSKTTQRNLNFRFQPEGNAKLKLQEFVKQIHETRAQRSRIEQFDSPDQIREKLKSVGFTKRELKEFQIRDLSHLLALSNGANFSVPGAGKTTVTFALHMLTRIPGLFFFVVAPKSAFQSWIDIVKECVEDGAPDGGDEPFTILSGSVDDTRDLLDSGAQRFIISYDMAIRQEECLRNHFASRKTHLVLDESHRMKAGWRSQRGAFFLRVAADPVRRDILTGTPMPQAATDIQSQLDFLWPGHGFGIDISLGKSPRQVLGNLYVRTTKKELGLPKASRHFIDVDMEPGQLALYSIVRNEFLQQFARNRSKVFDDTRFRMARRSVMRLLQLSVNPVLALQSLSNDNVAVESAIVDRVLEEGYSSKMLAVIEHAYELGKEGKNPLYGQYSQTQLEVLSIL